MRRHDSASHGTGAGWRRCGGRLARGLALLALVALAAAPAEAKKFRYAAGPKPATDTLLSVGQLELEPVRERGPRMAPTNLQLVSLVANQAFERAMADVPLVKGQEVVLAPAESHPLNFAVEHAVLKQLSKRGVVTQVRRAPVVDDSLAAASHTGSTATASPAVLDYQLASARVTYLRLRGWLPGRIKVERQALVEGRLTLRDPATSRVLWTGDASWNLIDMFPRSQLPLVEDDRFSDLKAAVPERGLNKVFEPVIVIGVVAGLVALFFQNRP